MSNLVKSGGHLVVNGAGTHLVRNPTVTEMESAGVDLVLASINNCPCQGSGGVYFKTTLLVNGSVSLAYSSTTGGGLHVNYGLVLVNAATLTQHALSDCSDAPSSTVVGDITITLDVDMSNGYPLMYELTITGAGGYIFRWNSANKCFGGTMNNSITTNANCVGLGGDKTGYGGTAVATLDLSCP